MDTSALSMTITSAAMGGTTSTTTSGLADGSASTGLNFGDVLGMMMGTDTGTSLLNNMNTTDPTALMYMAMFGGGTDWQSIQTTMMLDALKSLMNSEKPVVTDPELAQLLQTLKGLGQNGDEEQNMADILEVMAKMQRRLQEMMADSGGEMAGQQLLAVMAELNGSDPTAYSQMPTEARDALLNTALASDPAGLLKMLTGTDLPQQTNELVQPAAETPAQASAPQQVAAKGDTPQQPQAVEAELLTAEQTPDKALDVVQADARFAGMVREVRQQMEQAKATPQVQQTEKQDIDTLQSQVDTGMHLQNTGAANFAGTIEQAMAEQPAPVSTQLTNGIATALETGQEQLVVKLAPEELGEVTLKLTKTAEGMNLEVIAKNADTQRLLESQLELLRANLRPMKVEVESVMTESQYNTLSWQQQGFGGRQQDWNPMHGAAYYRDEPLGEVDLSVQQAVSVNMPATALDTYI